MNKTIRKVLGTVVLLGALCATGATPEATAEVNININLGPPPIVIAEPPALVLIPGLPVYFVPQLEFDVFFHGGFWWSPRGNAWYRASAYNGPWGLVEKRHVPAAVFQVPHDYRGRYEKEKPIPYGQWKKQGKRKHKKEHGH